MAELDVEGPLCVSGVFGMNKDGSWEYFVSGGFNYGPEWEFAGP